MSEWIAEALSQILGGDLSEDLTSYILSIENKSDFEEYMKTLLDFSNSEQRDLYENIKSVKFDVVKVKPKVTPNSSGNFVKSRSSISPPESDKKMKNTKKYTKYQLSELQKGLLRAGRNPCECEATKHKLINNCIECGRIVCEQEGSGPCFFCNNMVCTIEEKEILNSNTKQANVLYKTLTDRNKSENWKKAMEHRNQLLNFDKTCEQRTKLIDDEHDYFDINNTWLSKKEREKAAKRKTQDFERKHASKLGSRKITLDLIGRQAIEDTTMNYSYEEVDEEEDKKEHIEEQYNTPDINSIIESLRDNTSRMLSKKIGVLSIEDQDAETLKAKRQNYIIQDKMYLEMRDMGMCLSMHQPWASLLLLGIKQHEGRVWYTPHRGKLWIAAAAKEPEVEDIKEYEEFYKTYYNGKKLVFPTNYPTGCLLGSVLVQDCLGQEEYREAYPNGESESPFVMICSDPVMLPVAFPIQGGHKIYKLNSMIHKMAKDGLIVKRTHS